MIKLLAGCLAAASILLLPGCASKPMPADNSAELARMAGVEPAVAEQAPARRAEMARAEQAQIAGILQIRNGRLRRREALRVLLEAASGGNIRIGQELLRRFPGVLMMPNWPDVSARAAEQAKQNGHPEFADFLAEADRRRQAAAAGGMPPPPDDEGPGGPMPGEQTAPARASALASDVDTPKYHEAERAGDFAVIVGIQKYENLPDATFAQRDADAVRRHFLALGIPERNIVMLEGEKATRGKLQGYLEEWLPKNVTFDSNVYFYFSGHGAPDAQNGDAYLVPWDGDAKFLQSTAYPVKQLYADLAKLHAKQTVVALDSCFSGAGGRSVLAPGARPLVTQVSATQAPDSVTVLAAASGDEITGTLDDQGHGLFTYYFLKGLNDGRRSALDLFQYLKPHVEDEAHRQNREQTPTFTGGDSDL